MTESVESDPVIVDIIIPFESGEDDAVRKKAVSRKLRVHPARIKSLRLIKHSLDARKPQIKVQLRFEVGVDHELPEEEAFEVKLPSVGSKDRTVIIVGSGPAGLFAALTAIEKGWRPLVLERGKDASARRFDLAPILRHGKVIEDSNYCFGEGGAGTFSDGKLYTRATKRGPVRKVYEILVAHGAPRDILIDSHPHIGSNLLPNVVKAIRESIINAGGEVRFGAKVTDFLLDAGKLRGVVVNAEEEILADAVILATGHSARDIYSLLREKQILLEQKPFAVGVRIEHPQPLIDSLQYHYERGTGRPHSLPAARYNLATKVRGRGVHSFCMCPGGFVVPAATENDEVVVNGMSLSKRDSPFANSGMVVTVEPEDVQSFIPEHGILAGIAFQKNLEQIAKQAGGGGQVAPAQRTIDFLAKRDSKVLPETSYKPGLNEARLDQLMPHFIVERMIEGLQLFGRKMRGYVTDESNLIGFETRTSSPVRIPRNPETLQHPEVSGLYPCGEGAGFAGGIVSAALDGMRCASAL
ncbi:MAG: FAD-binding protein [Verrucomicrobiales bacterium]|nr:FAD-binding protein [Verrucomicrobiales bacterium]